ncbi:transmembrane protein 255A isoform X2 [Bombina bombina]|uniref:transmembrane protein 255A isoform X2 n=1 Tax=Bombina bombina TaxID=8345 RepID=UPI00235A922D|nr:transmembrane protein 255A isoform X2 [Bombina bombina]
MLTQQQSLRTEIPADSTGSFNKRRRKSIFVTVTLLVISILIFTVGLAATTRTENVTVGGYYPGVILGFGSILGIIGSNLIENKRQMDLRPLYAGKCGYYSSTYNDHTTEVTCQPNPRGPCVLTIKSNTCYCCDLYNCGRIGISSIYYEYMDVNSCQDVVHLYHLLWSVTILNIMGLFLGIITAAVLGGFKDMSPSIQAISCVEETPRPTVQYNTRPPVPSYNTYYHSTPHLPPYTAYDLQHSNIFPASTPSGLSDDPNSTSQSASSFMWPSNAPPRYSPPYFPPDEKPPPYTP